MTDHGGSPATLASRVVIAVLALLCLGVGALWMWSTATGLLWAGVPAWAIGMVVVALLVALALAVHRAADG